jgi:hypothetical protein
MAQDEKNRPRPTRGDQALAMLAESPHLERLTGLAILDGSVTERGVRTLLASRWIGQLETVWLDEGNVATSAMIALVDGCPNLFSLSASCTTEFPALAQRLPPLEEIELVRANDRALDELAQSLAGRSLTTLRLARNDRGAPRSLTCGSCTPELTDTTVSFEARARATRTRRLVILPDLHHDACGSPRRWRTAHEPRSMRAIGSARNCAVRMGVVKFERRPRFPWVSDLQVDFAGQRRGPHRDLHRRSGIADGRALLLALGLLLGVAGR